MTSQIRRHHYHDVRNKASLPRRSTTVESNLFVGDPEGQWPGCHPDPARHEAFVKAEEAFVADGDREAVDGILVQES